MDILLTEKQYKKVLLEEQRKSLESESKNNFNLLQKILSNVKKQYNIDFTFAFTWGITISGFVGPVTRFLEKTYTNLSEQEISLIMFGIILTFFSNNKEKLHQVLKLIKENKLITFFDLTLMKSYDLKESFSNFLLSLNVTFSSVSNMLAYSFLIPIIPLFQKVANFELSQNDIELILKSLSLYVSTSLTSSFLKEIVESIIKRFKS